MIMQYNYIAIEGTIGAGKTTLATRISNDFNGKLVLEEFEGDKNPFLPKFYKEPEKYSFQLEMTFLALRYQQLKDKLGALDLFHDFIISDYYVAKSLIFSRNNLQEDEYNIHKRGRSYEQEISDEYLADIQQGYLNFLNQQQGNMRILLLDTTRMDFVANESDYRRIIDAIDQPYDIGLHRVEL